MSSIINKQIRLLLEETGMTAAFANVSACIKMNYGRLNWAGFCFVRNGEPVLGPFQGKTSCTHIPFDKGVCGKCCTEASVQLVGDVLAFPGHIACGSRNELCAPIIADGKVIGVIDSDSPGKYRFTPKEAEEMTEAAADLADAFLRHNWRLD